MGREGVSDEMGELSMGRCSLLVGLRSSSQSLDQLALLLRELWNIMAVSGGDEFNVISIEEAVCRQMVG